MSGPLRIALWLAALLLLPAAIPASAHPGTGIVEDAQGNIYYTDLEQVWRLAPDGGRTIAVPRVHTHELHLDSAGNLYGEHTWYEGEATNRWGYRVWRRTPDGRIGNVVPPTAGFRTDYSFVRDSSGNMYSADPQGHVVRRRPDGSKVRLSERAFGDVRSMTASPDGIVHLIAGGALWRIEPDGAAREIASGLSEQVESQPFVDERHRIMGLWSDDKGNVYAAIFGGRKVKRIDPQGRVTVAARSTFPWSPSGGLVARDGRLWLLEYSVDNAVRIRPADGARNGRLWLWIGGAALLLAAPFLVWRWLRARRI
jgi:sugar lactone lactonase YvrE